MRDNQLKTSKAKRREMLVQITLAESIKRIHVKAFNQAQRHAIRYCFSL
jgi:hypothetical protein